MQCCTSYQNGCSLLGLPPLLQYPLSLPRPPSSTAPTKSPPAYPPKSIHLKHDPVMPTRFSPTMRPALLTTAFHSKQHSPAPSLPHSHLKAPRRLINIFDTSRLQLSHLRPYRFPLRLLNTVSLVPPLPSHSISSYICWTFVQTTLPFRPP